MKNIYNAIIHFILGYQLGNFVSELNSDQTDCCKRHTQRICSHEKITLLIYNIRGNNVIYKFKVAHPFM